MYIISGNIFVSYILKFVIQLCTQHLQSMISFTLSPCASLDLTGLVKNKQKTLIHAEAEKQLTKTLSKTGGLNSLKLYYMLE